MEVRTLEMLIRRVLRACEGRGEERGGAESGRKMGSDEGNE